MKKIKAFIPNFLTSLRVINTPIIIIFFILKKYDIALIVSILTAITDCFDGFLARKFNTVSEFGKKLDAFSDKIFAGGLLICLAIKFYILWICVLLELIISIINLIAYHNDNKTRTIMIGKIKTCALFLSIILGYLACFYNTNILLYISLFLTIPLQLICVLNYYSRYLRKKKVS